jgi:hypothetical protein
MSSETKSKRQKKAKIFFWTGLALGGISWAFIDNLHWQTAFLGIGAVLAVYGFILGSKK